MPPSSQRSSPAGKSFAGLLFQFTSSPFDGLMSCGCLDACQEALPLELAAAVDRQVVVDALGPHGSRPVVTNAMSFVVGVERVERLRRGRGRADEVLRAASRGPNESRWKKIWSVVSRPMLERFWESATTRSQPATRA